MIFSTKFKASLLTAFICTCVQLTFLSGASSYDEVFHNLGSDIKEAGYSKSLKISQWVGDHQILVESFQHAISTAPEPRNVKSFLDNIAWDDSYIYSYFGSNDGDMTMIPALTLPPGYDPRNRPWYSRTHDAMTTTLSEPYEDAGTKELILTLTTPVLNDEKFLGVFGVDINTRTLINLLTPEATTGINQFFIVTQDGKILFHPNKDVSLTFLNDTFQTGHIDIKDNYAVTLENSAGTTLLFYKIMNLPASNWYLCAAITNKEE
ncbi:cache domain-containing protein [uncultured Kiloniella sp.]|uniref:PDC sensor domain-containing protein n=1 Tax=uncultured Kiloniella sp. TaxID=1133091 RepID=UPI00260846CF|nr:cache domain-containing protein [uncultured Kiloniella sp.]